MIVIEVVVVVVGVGAGVVVVVVIVGAVVDAVVADVRLLALQW